MYIYIYIFIEREGYIYIYIYICILSGPWRLSGRFRYVSVIHVSVAFLSRFRNVSVTDSVAFPLHFRSRFRCASVGQAPARQKLSRKLAGGRADPKPSLFLHSGSYLVSDPIPGVDVFRRALRYSSNTGEVLASDAARVQGSHWPECISTLSRRHLKNQWSHWGHVGSSVFQRFRRVSVNVSSTFSSTFPSTFPLRFRYVSVWQVCARWKLSGNSPSVSGAH